MSTTTAHIITADAKSLRPQITVWEQEQPGGVERIVAQFDIPNGVVSAEPALPDCAPHPPNWADFLRLAKGWRRGPQANPRRVERGYWTIEVERATLNATPEEA